MSHPQQTRSLSSSITELNHRNVEQLGNDPISLLLKDAAVKTGAKPVGDINNPTYVADPMASMIDINLGQMLSLPTTGTNTTHDMQFKDVELRLAIAQASAYLRAGVGLAVTPDPYENNTSGQPGVNFGQNQFLTVTPVVLQNIAEGQELVSTASPVKFSPYKFAETGSLGVSFTVSRRQMKDTPFLALHGMIYQSLLSGIGSAIDKTISAKIAASTPAAFTLAAAAAANVKASEIIGVTDGSSAKASMVEGKLYLDGFQAELSAAEGSYLVVPKTFAVAIPEKLTVIVKRLMNGAFEFTLWVDLTALSTDDSLAWSVE